LSRSAIRLLALCALAGACNALNGSGDLAIGDGIDAALTDGATAIDGAPIREGGSDSPVDPPANDGGVDACAANTTSRVVDLGAKNAAAYRSTRTKTIDAVLDDWDCATPLILDGSHTASTRYDAGAGAEMSSQVYAEWDDANLYVAWVATTVLAPQGANAMYPFQNDSVELYIGGEGALVGSYRPVDREYVVDYKNLVGVYSTPPNPSKTGFTSHALASANGFVVEMQIAASVVGLVTLGAGKKLGFDLGSNRGNGATQVGQQFWAYASPVTCTCTSSCCCGAGPGVDQPSCNTLRWSLLELR
jgi:hypothetical protein